MTDFNDLKTAIDKVVEGTESIQHLKTLLSDEDLNVNDIGIFTMKGEAGSLQGPALHYAMISADHHNYSGDRTKSDRAREVVMTLLEDDRIDLSIPSMIKRPEEQEASLNTLMCAVQTYDFEIFEKCFNHATMDAKAQLSAQLPVPPNLGEGRIMDSPLNFLALLSFKEHAASAHTKGEHDPTWTLIRESNAYKEIMEEYKPQEGAEAAPSRGGPGSSATSE